MPPAPSAALWTGCPAGKRRCRRTAEAVRPCDPLERSDIATSGNNVCR